MHQHWIGVFDLIKLARRAIGIVDPHLLFHGVAAGSVGFLQIHQASGVNARPRMPVCLSSDVCGAVRVKFYD